MARVQAEGELLQITPTIKREVLEVPRARAEMAERKASRQKWKCVFIKRNYQFVKMDEIRSETFILF